MTTFAPGILRYSLAIVFSATSIAVLAQGAKQAPAPTLYDDFSQKLIDPSKWTASNACYSSNGLEMECVREIQSGTLLLAHRNFGQRDTDSGSQFGGAFLNFINPASIRNITTDIVVQTIEEVPCSANPQFGGAVHIDATFFNAGSGFAADDIGAQFGLSRAVTDPKGQIFVWAQVFQGSNYFGVVPLGFISIGTPAAAALTWDQTNHQFIATITNKITNAHRRITLPYSFSDTTPAFNPSKDLAVINFPANCTSSAASVYSAATFDNVLTAQ